MADKSFNNVIIKREVSLAIEQILIAPATQVWTPGRVSMSHTALPTGFRHLGAVVEDQVSLTINRELFQLQTGLPRVLQYSAVVGVGGRLEVQFHSFSPRKMAYALGNVDPVTDVNTIVAMGNTAQGYTTVVLGAEIPTLKVGDVLVTATSTAGIATTDNEAEVSSIGTGASSLTVHLTSPGFVTAPNTTWFIGKVTQVKQPFGTSKIKEFAILGVADTIDGYQVVHHMAKARVAPGDMQDAFRPTENGRIQGRWDLYGYNVAGYGADTELIVGERFWYPLA